MISEKDLCLISSRFGNNLANYPIYENSTYAGISKNIKYIIAIHNSGDAKEIYDKLWKNKEISIEEKAYLKLLNIALVELPSINQKVFRYEINTSKEDLNNTIKDILKKKKNNQNFICPSFWNFSENTDWILRDVFKWFIIPRNNSKIKVVHMLYGFEGEQGKSEKEVIVPIHTEFEIVKIQKKSIILKET